MAAADIRQDEDYIVVQDDGNGRASGLVRRLVMDGVDIEAMVPAFEQGLEDMFLELTAKE